MTRSSPATETLLPCPFCAGPAVNVGGEYVTCGAAWKFDCAGHQLRCLPHDWNARHDEAATTRGCICQDQHRRGYCTEPGCPYNRDVAQAAWKPDLLAARNAVRDEIGSRLCHMTPHGTRICTRQVSSTCLCEETARAALCSQAPTPSIPSTPRATPEFNLGAYIDDNTDDGR